MKREIREVVTVDGQQILQVTMQDERWYARQVSTDGTAENKHWDFVPSVTWITGKGYPKGFPFMKWLANSSGWDEAEAARIFGGEKGSKVHQACWLIASGGTFSLQHSEFENPTTHQSETLNCAECHCVMTFAEWWNLERPEVIAIEQSVWNERYRYAGTIDLKCRLRSTNYNPIHVIDLKTSPNVYPEMELQVSAYKHADPTLPKSGVKLGILQVGYTRNKKQQYKYTEVPDRFPLFLAAYKIWKHETAGQKPLQRDFPLELKLS